MPRNLAASAVLSHWIGVDMAVTLAPSRHFMVHRSAPKVTRRPQRVANAGVSMLLHSFSPFSGSHVPHCGVTTADQGGSHGLQQLPAPGPGALQPALVPGGSSRDRP